MQKHSWKKFSALGIILLAASAVASALKPTPQKSMDDCNGIFEFSTMADDNGLGIERTCTVAVDDADCWTCTGNGSGMGSSSGTSGGVTTAADTKLSHGVAGCITMSY
jgi:hypothetical protein